MISHALLMIFKQLLTIYNNKILISNQMRNGKVISVGAKIFFNILGKIYKNSNFLKFNKIFY